MCAAVYSRSDCYDLCILCFSWCWQRFCVGEEYVVCYELLLFLLIRFVRKKLKCVWYWYYVLRRIMYFLWHGVFGSLSKVVWFCVVLGSIAVWFHAFANSIAYVCSGVFAIGRQCWKRGRHWVTRRSIRTCRGAHVCVEAAENGTESIVQYARARWLLLPVKQ